MRPFWIPKLLLQKVWDPMILRILFKESTNVIPLCSKVDQVSFFVCGKCQVLFQHYSNSSWAARSVALFSGPWCDTSPGAQRRLQWSLGCNCSLPFCGRCCVINSGHSATRSKSEHQDSAVKKNWQWCTATLHSTGALPNEFESDTHSPKKAKHWLMTWNITAALIRYFQ